MVWFGALLTGLAMALVLWVPNYALVIAMVIASGLGSAMFHPEALARVPLTLEARLLGPGLSALTLSCAYATSRLRMLGYFDSMTSEK